VVVAFCYRRVNDPELAADLAAEVFATAFVSETDGDGAADNPVAVKSVRWWIPTETSLGGSESVLLAPSGSLAIGEEQAWPSGLVGSRLAAGAGLDTRGWSGFVPYGRLLAVLRRVWRRRLRSDAGCG
jgi:hypothetical protein